MAKKPQKKSKHAVKGPRNAGPLAVLYNLDAGSARGDAVRAVLGAHGIRMKTATPDMLGNPVGALAGLPGFKLSGKPYDGPAPEVEFMLLSGIAGERLTVLLDAMRAADASVGCKAQVTQHNRLWPFATLIAEVSREHAALNVEKGQTPFHIVEDM